MQPAFRLFFLIFILIGSLLGGLATLLYQSEIKSLVQSMGDGERQAVALMEETLARALDGISADLMLLTAQNELGRILAGDDAARAEAAAEYLAMARHKKVYDQIRFLDSAGMERVRINNNAGHPSIIPDATLQDKGGRYYFTDVFVLRPGEVFVSPFDLNIEHGKVERPLKPMIRFGTPVADASGRKQGIVLLNYLGADLLSRLAKASEVAEGQAMLLNADGYWLLAADAEDAWGFMLPDRAQRRFSTRYPEAWRAIRERGVGQVRTANGLFTFATVRPLSEQYRSSTGAAEAFAQSEGTLHADDYEWTLISHIPRDVIRSMSARIRLRLFLLGGGAFATISIGAWFLALAIVRRREYQARLQSLAHFDALTGLPNRVLFFDRLRVAHRNAQRYGRPFGLLFLDLDGFKEVNDGLGHDAGDAVLVEVARRLTGAIRRSDTVARLGGDELAIILTEIRDIDDVVSIGRKLVDLIGAPITLDNTMTEVGVSIGAAIHAADNETAEQVLARADRAMYVAKSRGKGACVASDEVSERQAESP